MRNESERWLKTFIVVLCILIFAGCNIAQEQRIAKTNEILDTYKRALEEWAYPEEELVITMPVTILFWYEGYDYFKDVPMIFLRITNTNLSKCFINNRLKVDLNGEIYWIRLER